MVLNKHSPMDTVDVAETKPLPPPTRRWLHGYDYTPAQRAEREGWLRRLRVEWPHVDPYYHELVYDFCANTPQSELDRLMESGELDKRESLFSTRNVRTLLASYDKATDADLRVA